MKKIVSCAFVSVILFVLTGCNQFEQGEGDLLLTMHTNASGPAIQTGELAELTVVEKTEEDSILQQATGDDRTILVIQQPAVFTGDLFTALGKMSEGDSATVKINLDSMVSKMGYSKPANTKGKFIVYELAVQRVLHKGNMTDSQYKQAMDTFVKNRMEQLQQDEAGRIARFIKEKKLKTTAQPSGLQYMITASSSGTGASAGDTVAIHYTARFLNGKVIDVTHAQPRQFIAGSSTVIAGLNEAFGLFPPGAKAIVVIPAALAFGVNGYQGIQPYTPLIYDLEIVRIGRFTGKAPAEQGADIPDFAVTNIANDMVIQKEDVAKGKCIFVLFTTDCDHCQQLITNVDKHYTAFKNIHWYFVSADSAEAIQQCMQQYGKGLIAKNNVMILQDADHMVAGAFRATAYPALYMYDGRHKLIKHVAGEVALTALRGL